MSPRLQKLQLMCLAIAVGALLCYRWRWYPMAFALGVPAAILLRISFGLMTNEARRGSTGRPMRLGQLAMVAWLIFGLYVYLVQPEWYEKLTLPSHYVGILWAVWWLPLLWVGWRWLRSD